MVINESNISFIRPLSRRGATKYIVLHHSASGTTITLQDVNRWHLNNGWSGIGYHYVIYADGQIWRGRPENTVGAHAYYSPEQEANSNGIGICLIGNFETGRPTAAQMDSVAWLILDIQTRYPAAVIKGHRDIMPTACPGKNFPWQALEEKLKEAKKVAYQRVAEVPEWGQKIIQALVNRKSLRGDEKGNLQISEDLLRTLVILEREGVIKQ